MKTVAHKSSTHWTARSTENFLFRIAADFIASIEAAMTAGVIKQSDLASALGVSEGRVSQFLNNPGNLTLKKIIEYARVLGLKVAIVTYNDGDIENKKGPINSEIFSKCWEHTGKPRDFFELNELHQSQLRNDLMTIRVFVSYGSVATTDSSSFHIVPRTALRAERATP